MKQLSLFGESDIAQQTDPVTTGATWKLFIDGASRNNPGLAGAGIYITKNDELVLQEGFFLGTKTNNQAEYLSLILGLLVLKQYVRIGDEVQLFSDSELLVKQLNGIYKIKNPLLKPLYEYGLLLLRAMNATITHVLRSYNAVADKMANQGIAKKKPLPRALQDELLSHGISI